MTVLSRDDLWTTANNIIAKNVRSIEKDSPRTSDSEVTDIYHINEGECQASDKLESIADDPSCSRRAR